MSEFTEASKCLEYPMQNIKNLRITCKNYRVHLCEGAGDTLVIRYRNNRFRRMEVKTGSTGIELKEEMAVTFYGILRLFELMKDNELEIEIPAACRELNIEVETISTEMELDSLCASNLRLHSVGGQIRLRDVSIAHSLSAISESGQIVCTLPGSEEDYDIDCRIERSDAQPGMNVPYYAPNRSASRKIVLRSKTYMPELMLTKDIIR